MGVPKTAASMPAKKGSLRKLMNAGINHLHRMDDSNLSGCAMARNIRICLWELLWNLQMFGLVLGGSIFVPRG